jgi:hypothetical protein
MDDLLGICSEACPVVYHMSEFFTQEAFGFHVEVANQRFWLAVVAGRWMLNLRGANLHRFYSNRPGWS